MITPFYHVFTPASSGSFSLQWESCFQQLTICISRGWIPFRIHIFVHSRNSRDFSDRRQTIQHSFGNTGTLPVLPFSVIPQSPPRPQEVTIEAGFVHDDCSAVSYFKSDGLSYAVISGGSEKEIWITGMTSNGLNDDINTSASVAFEHLVLMLQKEKTDFNRIVRQWNYIGEILKCTGNGENLQQNYQMFNETRNRYYSAYRNVPAYPAATGIGMSCAGVMIDCFALNSDVIEIIPVKNPNQTNSYQYRQNILAGGNSFTRKQPPQFERGLLLNDRSGSRFLISGTASILGEETVGTDVESQTRNTIQNMEALASAENLKHHCPHLQHFPVKYTYLRVYVKHRQDMEKVKQICSAHFGSEVPVTYVQADICRDNLLVEIEGEKSSQ